jgi:hypothetical protein
VNDLKNVHMYDPSAIEPNYKFFASSYPESYHG